MNEQLTATTLLTEHFSEPFRLEQPSVAPVIEPGRIILGGNVYISNASYEDEAFKPVAGIGEVATKVVASAPVEGTYHRATEADMQAAFLKYGENHQDRQKQEEAAIAAIAAHQQQDMINLVRDLSESEDEESDDKVLVRV